MRKGLFLALAALAAFGCERRERTSRETGREIGEKVGEVGREVGEGARDLGREVTEGAKDVAGETRELGRGVREGMKGTPRRTLTSDERAELEAAAARGGYQVVFEENGAITAMKVEPLKQPVAGQEMSDADVEAAVKAKLHGQPGAETIQVQAHGGAVTLTGPFDAVGGPARAISLALESPGVQQVTIEP